MTENLFITLNKILVVVKSSYTVTLMSRTVFKDKDNLSLNSEFKIDSLY